MAFLDPVFKFPPEGLSISTQKTVLWYIHAYYLVNVLCFLCITIWNWNLNTNKVNSRENWSFWNMAVRHMLKISRTDNITNKRVLERIGKDKKLLTKIKARNLEYMGHVIPWGIANGTKYSHLNYKKISREKVV